MEGRAVLTLLNHNEEYVITQPNMYARLELLSSSSADL